MCSVLRRWRGEQAKGEKPRASEEKPRVRDIDAQHQYFRAYGPLIKPLSLSRHSLEELVAQDQVLWEIGRGRLDVRVEEAEGVVGEDSNLQCYTVVKFGKASKKGDFYRKSRTTKKVTDRAPKFGGEMMQLKLRDLSKLWKQFGWKDGDKVDDEGLKLTVVVYDDNYMKDKEIGKVEIDVREVSKGWREERSYEALRIYPTPF